MNCPDFRNKLAQKGENNVSGEGGTGSGKGHRKRLESRHKDK